MKDDPSRTAEAVCLFRAAEQRRPEATRILNDPYSKHFLGPLMRTALSAVKATGRFGERIESLTPGLGTYILARHKFIDDALQTALDAGVAQVVVLGAGYDTRAIRFKDRLAGRPVYELDFPATSRRKVSLIREDQGLEQGIDAAQHLEIDFMEDRVEDVLARAGFDASRSTFFVWEGVSMYLTRAAVKHTLSTLCKLSGAGSQLAMDFWFLLDTPDRATAALRVTPNLLQLLSEPILFGIHPEDVPDFMRRLDIEVVDLADASELASRHVRDERQVYPACFTALASLA